MLDLDLEDGRTAPAPRKKRESLEGAKSDPQANRWRWEGPSQRATEAMLHEELDALFESLCNLDWREAYDHARMCGDIWCALPEMTRITLAADFPCAPGALSAGVGDAWVAYAFWHSLWWRHEVPSINHATGRIEYASESV